MLAVKHRAFREDPIAIPPDDVSVEAQDVIRGFYVIVNFEHWTFFTHTLPLLAGTHLIDD